MGVKLDVVNEGSEYRTKIYEMVELLLYRLLRPWLHADKLYELLGHRRALDKHLVPIHNFTKNIINQRRAQFHQNILNNNNVEETVDENENM